MLELVGVKSVDVDLATDRFTTTYDASVVHSDAMLAAIVEVGYRPSVVSSNANLRVSTNLGQIPELISNALREAEERDQLVFMDFHAPWCGACRKLEETTLSDPKVNALLSSFVVLKIDTDAHPSIGKYFGVVGLPTILVLDAAGQSRFRNVGPIDARTLESALLAK